MVDGLLDTNIFIDISRNYEPALSWLNNQTLQFGVSSITRIELMLGARNKLEMQKIDKLLQAFNLFILMPQILNGQWSNLKTLI